ncbi:MAG: bacteriohemerythrin [Thermodesulfobacteriota bacterium]
MPIEWKEELSVGVEKIDSQHKELIRRVNDLFASMGSDKHADKLEGAIRYFEEYIDTHFTLEEDYMKRYDYPGSDEHKKEHEEFKAAIAEFKAALAESGVNLALTTKTNTFIGSWFMNHVSKIDIKLADFLKTKL